MRRHHSPCRSKNSSGHGKACLGLYGPDHWYANAAMRTIAAATPHPRQAVDPTLVGPHREGVHSLTGSRWNAEAVEPSHDFPGTEKRRRRDWRERVGNAGASFVWRGAYTSSPSFPRNQSINGLLYARER